MSELTAKEYLKIKKRMTEMRVSGCGISCRECPLSYSNNKRYCACKTFESEYTDEAIAIVEKWNKEHPSITNLQHYAEELRKVGFHVDVDVLKTTCPIHVSPHFVKGYICKGTDDCDECEKWWDKEYKGVEE